MHNHISTDVNKKVGLEGERRLSGAGRGGKGPKRRGERSPARDGDGTIAQAEQQTRERNRGCREKVAMGEVWRKQTV